MSSIPFHYDLSKKKVLNLNLSDSRLCEKLLTLCYKNANSWNYDIHKYNKNVLFFQILKTKIQT